jgi:hypothetical protein
MCTTLLDLSTHMALAYSNNDGPHHDASLDPARRIFKDNTARGTVQRHLAARRNGSSPGFPPCRRGSSTVIITLGGTMPTQERQPCVAQDMNKNVFVFCTSAPERSAIATQYLSMIILDSAFGMLRTSGPHPNSVLLTAGLVSRKIGHHIPSPSIRGRGSEVSPKRVPHTMPKPWNSQ